MQTTNPKKSAARSLHSLGRFVRLSCRDPYVIDFSCWRFRLSIWRRCTPSFCASWANSYPQRGGNLPDWATWCWWKTRTGWHWWRKPNTEVTGSRNKQPDEKP